MKKVIFYLVGAIFLFASCQSDLIGSDDVFLNEVSKSDKATKVEKEMTFMSYEGIIITEGDDFLQTGSGIASHIGRYTFENTSKLSDFDGEFKGVMIAANGDEIHYDTPVIVCDPAIPAPNFCPGQNATFNYTIRGGTGRFEEASGTIIIEGIFVPEGPFNATGTAVITY
jgi:hypothetical protein